MIDALGRRSFRGGNRGFLKLFRNDDTHVPREEDPRKPRKLGNAKVARRIFDASAGNRYYPDNFQAIYRLEYTFYDCRSTCS